jgi:TolA-binding protein
MKTTSTVLLLTMGAIVLGATVFIWSTSDEPVRLPQLSEKAQTPSATMVSPVISASREGVPAPERSLEKRLAALEESVKELQQEVTGLSREKATKLAALEATVKALQKTMAGISLEGASADRQKLFAAEEGYLKADEYAAAGQYAIAGEGYLTFLQNHPDHADARDVMKKARDSFLKAGYKDKAFWVQEEMMKSFPQFQSADLWEQAGLEKEAGLYDNAVNHAAQAAEMASNPEERLWRRLYWAWYVQLRDGTPAGIAALQQVQREIATSGVNNPRLAENAAQRMQEWQRLRGR